MTEAPHERLDRMMNERRIQLRMSWRDVAQAAGVSEAALRNIRRGISTPAELTAAHLDDALQWPAGRLRAVLADGPGAMDQPRVDRMTLEEIEERRAYLLAALAELDSLEHGREDETG